MTVITTATTALTDIVTGTSAALAQNPNAGVITPAARTRFVRDTGTKVEVDTSAHSFVIDEPAALGIEIGTRNSRAQWRSTARYWTP